ncbi:hypothetical protein Pmani_010339, partial [Petrolisthes manimaculis]
RGEEEELEQEENSKEGRESVRMREKGEKKKKERV